MLLSTLLSACLIILINKQSLINTTGNTVTWGTECRLQEAAMQPSSCGSRGENRVRDSRKWRWMNRFEPIAFEAEFEICSGAREAGIRDLDSTAVLAGD